MLLQINQEVVIDAAMERDYAEVIITAMRRRGVTQQQLAEALGLDDSTVSRKLQPGKRWWVDQYVMALEYLEVDPEDALGSGRRIGEIKKEEKGGAMGGVVPLLMELRICREFPDRMLGVLRCLADIEKSNPEVIEKLLHDIEYHHERLRKTPAALQKHA